MIHATDKTILVQILDCGLTVKQATPRDLCSFLNLGWEYDRH